MNNQKGFTLIELVVVIVILGILAAVAVPKFVDMQGEAKKGVLEGVRGSWKSAVMMAHAKWLAGGGNTSGLDLDNDSSTGDDDGYEVTLTKGYPAATVANLKALVDLDNFNVEEDSDTDEFTAEASGTTLTVTYGDYSFDYTETSDSNIPPVTTAVE
jgi:MSHA pilin protein MshA